MRCIALGTAMGSVLPKTAWKHHASLRLLQRYSIATRPVFAGTSRFSACLSRVPVERLPGRYMSRFFSITAIGLLL